MGVVGRRSGWATDVRHQCGGQWGDGCGSRGELRVGGSTERLCLAVGFVPCTLSTSMHGACGSDGQQRGGAAAGSRRTWDWCVGEV
jgi:hypothetical protein